MIDLYAELGLEKGCSPQDIKKAYRRLMKSSHPDAPNGSREKYDRVSLAYSVLFDPIRRAHYDATGEIADKPADNVVSQLLAALSQLFGPAMDAVMQAGKAPEECDLVAIMIDKAEDALDGVDQRVAGLKKNMEMLEAIRDRFIVDEDEDAEEPKPNHMLSIIRGQQAQCESTIKNMEAGARDLQAAKLYLQGVKFNKKASVEEEMAELLGTHTGSFNIGFR